MGIIEYFTLLKINAAKEMIRTGHLNFTQISEQTLAIPLSTISPDNSKNRQA